MDKVKHCPKCKDDLIDTLNQYIGEKYDNQFCPKCGTEYIWRDSKIFIQVVYEDGSTVGISLEKLFGIAKKKGLTCQENHG
jgi:ribosomal protein S27AE